MELQEQKQKMGLAVKTFEANVAIMDEKTTKALVVLSGIKKIDSADDEEKARHWLGRVRPTFETVQKLRKEITDPLDVIKKELMEYEKKISTTKGSGSEYARVKTLLDQYANKKAAEAKIEQDRIEHEKNVKLETADIKSKLIKSIELGTFDLIKNGEVQLTKYVAEMTLENFDEKLGKLNYKPKMSPDAFKKLMTVSYNPTLISSEDYQKIITDFGEKFEYKNINDSYCEQSSIILERVKLKDIPEHKAELDKLAAAVETGMLDNAAVDPEKLKEKLAAIDNTYAIEKQAVEEKADDVAGEAKIDAEFEAQVSKQSIEQQTGIRKNISYAFDDKAIGKMTKVIETMAKVITHVLADAKYKGIIKKDSQGFPKMDSDGKIQYVDGINYWLKEMAKLNIDTDEVNIPNLVKTEDVSTIVRA